MLTPTGPVDPNLADALREAGDRVATMTPVQRALMAARQAVSYVEGGLGVALPDDHEAKITVRALALLDRVGDAAADALIKGEAAVVPVEATEAMDTAYRGALKAYIESAGKDDPNIVREPKRPANGRSYGHIVRMRAKIRCRYAAMLSAGRLDRENDNA
jgi:hypothetical protein